MCTSNEITAGDETPVVGVDLCPETNELVWNCPNCTLKFRSQELYVSHNCRKSPSKTASGKKKTPAKAITITPTNSKSKNLAERMKKVTKSDDKNQKAKKSYQQKQQKLSTPTSPTKTPVLTEQQEQQVLEDGEVIMDIGALEDDIDQLADMELDSLGDLVDLDEFDVLDEKEGMAAEENDQQEEFEDLDDVERKRDKEE